MLENFNEYMNRTEWPRYRGQCFLNSDASFLYKKAKTSLYIDKYQLRKEVGWLERCAVT